MAEVLTGAELATLFGSPDALACLPLLDAGHGHSLDAIVGYVVRRTVADGVTLRRPYLRDRIGYDVTAMRGDRQYLAALAKAREYRELVNGSAWTWAVVDLVYRCGCRSC